MERDEDIPGKGKKFKFFSIVSQVLLQLALSLLFSVRQGDLLGDAKPRRSPSGAFFFCTNSLALMLIILPGKSPHHFLSSPSPSASNASFHKSNLEAELQESQTPGENQSPPTLCHHFTLQILIHCVVGISDGSNVPLHFVFPTPSTEPALSMVTKISGLLKFH